MLGDARIKGTWREPVAAAGSSQRLAILEEENDLLRAVIDNFPGGILLFDRNLTLVLCSERQKKLLDYPPALFEYGMPGLEQVIRFNAVRGEYGPGDVEAHVRERMQLVARREAHHYQRTRPNGTVLEVRGVPLPGGGFLTTYVDITGERPRAAAESSAPAAEIPTWQQFLTSFDQAQARVRRGQVVAIQFIDLDHFKQVEQRFGGQISEALARGVALRIKTLIRGTDAMARLGDDEFVVLQTEVDRPSNVARLSSRIIDAIKQPFEFANSQIMIDASIGVAMAPRDGTVIEELIDKAQQNLRRARSETGEKDTLQYAPNVAGPV